MTRSTSAHNRCAHAPPESLMASAPIAAHGRNRRNRHVSRRFCQRVRCAAYQTSGNRGDSFRFYWGSGVAAPSATTFPRSRPGPDFLVTPKAGVHKQSIGTHFRAGIDHRHAHAKHRLPLIRPTATKQCRTPLQKKKSSQPPSARADTPDPRTDC